MKGPISLAQGLRAIRNGGGSEGFKQPSDSGDTECPWQADIDRVQQTLQDVLQAVSQLSGVELPGVGANQNRGESVPRLDCETLKDRIRNDLDAFSAGTTADITRKAEEQARAALRSVQDEVSGQVDQLTREFHEKLQEQLKPEGIETDFLPVSRERAAELVQMQTDEFAHWAWLMCKGTGTPIPAQIEKLLEPYTEGALATFTSGFQRRVQDLLAEKQQLVQERLQKTTRSLESQVSALEQTSLQVCEGNAEAVTKQSAERLGALAEEAARNFQKWNADEIEATVGRFHTRLEEVAASSQEEWRRLQEQDLGNFKNRLDALGSEVRERQVSEMTARIEQTAADMIESSVQHLHQQSTDTVEHSKEEVKAFMQLEMEEVRVQIRELGSLAHESLSQHAARQSDSLKGLDRDLSEIQNKHIAASDQQMSGLVQETMESLSERIKQLADTQLEGINRFVLEAQNKAPVQYESQLREAADGHSHYLLERIQKEAGEAGSKVAEEVRTTSESVMQELSDKVNTSASMLREEAIQASSRIESSIKNSLDTYQQQLAQITSTGLEEQHRAISKSVSDLQNRIRLAARLLEGEGPEDVVGAMPNVAETGHGAGGGS